MSDPGNTYDVALTWRCIHTGEAALAAVAGALVGRVDLCNPQEMSNSGGWACGGLCPRAGRVRERA